MDQFKYLKSKARNIRQEDFCKSLISEYQRKIQTDFSNFFRGTVEHYSSQNKSHFDA